MRYGKNSAFRTPSSSKPVIESRQIGFSYLDGGPCRLYESGTQPPIAISNSARVALARTFIVAGRYLGPTCQMCGRWKTAHVRPDLSQQQFCCPAADAGDRIQQFDCCFQVSGCAAAKVASVWCPPVMVGGSVGLWFLWFACATCAMCRTISVSNRATCSSRSRFAPDAAPA